MTRLKIQTIENSNGVILPDELMQRLNVQAGDTLYVSEAPDGSLRLTAYDPAFGAQIDAAKQGASVYRDALRKLAD